MICHEFKGGIGTASRVLGERQGGYSVGVLCPMQPRQAARPHHRGRARRAGDHRPDAMLCSGRAAGATVAARYLAALRRDGGAAQGDAPAGRGSIIVVVATDAPLMPHQLKRLARRTALGFALVGGKGHNDSGDLMIAFSTANPRATEAPLATVTMLANERINALFGATIEATEEAIINAMLAAETMTGADGVTVHALPQDRLVEILKRHRRFAATP